MGESASTRVMPVHSNPISQLEEIKFQPAQLSFTKILLVMFSPTTIVLRPTLSVRL